MVIGSSPIWPTKFMNEIKIQRQGTSFSKVYFNEKLFCGMVEDVGDVTDIIYLIKNILIALKIQNVTLIEEDHNGQISRAIIIE